MNKTIISKQFDLQARDWLKGLLIAVCTPMLYIIQEMIPGWNIDPIFKAGISAGITYLLKNFFEPTKIVEIKQVKKKPVFKSDEQIGI